EPTGWTHRSQSTAHRFEELRVAMRSVIRRALGPMGLASLIAVASGCGDGPALVPVSGIVTLDGQALEGATLSFVPDTGNAISTAGTDVRGRRGNFQMTYGGRAGLSPGKYKVLVSKTEEVAPKSGKEISPIFAKASFEKQLMGLTKETIPAQKLQRDVEVP